MVSGLGAIGLINGDVVAIFPGLLPAFAKAHLYPKRLTFDMTPSAVNLDKTPQLLTSCLPPSLAPPGYRQLAHGR